MTNDGHDTDCKWNACAHPEAAAPCPFVDELKTKCPEGHEMALNGCANIYCRYTGVQEVPTCKHEWRQLQPMVDVPEFFCIFCKHVD